MKTKTIFALFLAIFLSVGILAISYLFLNDQIAVLHPKGMIGEKQFNLLVLATCLMLVVVIPVFVMTFGIAWKYRAENKQAKYDPDWDNSYLAEAVWWGVPCAIIVVLGVFTWIGCHELDPFKPIPSAVKPIRIQAVALRWKWLFIYPEQGVASVNYLCFPENTPLNFEITSDAPMNSFWIPELGGQVYAMAGMKSKLHLIANQRGQFRGSSANISGKGFSGMSFTAEATSEADFADWVERVKQEGSGLDRTAYREIFKPSEYDPVSTYTLTDDYLFDWIVLKYMAPSR